MKKILNIFASISLITTGASSVVACGDNQPFNPFNLSTWGANQINLIQSYYLSSFVIWYVKPTPPGPIPHSNTNWQWSDWLREGALQEAIDTINPNVVLGQVGQTQAYNCTYTYNPKPSSQSDAKTILNNGLTVFLQGDKNKYIEGSLRFTLKL